MFNRTRSVHHLFHLLLGVSFLVAACQTAPRPIVLTQPATIPTSASRFQDKPALSNDSGIEGVQTYPDRAIYHDHVTVVPTPEGNLPPTFGAHFPYWQNCGIYDQPVELGTALHSMEHGAVWLTYKPDLSASDVISLQSLVRGHSYAL